MGLSNMMWDTLYNHARLFKNKRRGVYNVLRNTDRLEESKTTCNMFSTNFGFGYICL